MNINWLKVKSFVKGFTSSSIQYNPILPNGDSSPYFGTYEGQRFGQYDTDCCWDFSGCEVAETRLQMLTLKGLIPQNTMAWLKSNGYIDSQGDFYLSRRWVAILSGVRDGGNQQINFWNLASVAGLIPNSMLPYDPTEAQRWITKDQFNNDYFNPKVITKEMELLGLEFLKRFTIQAEIVPGGYISDIRVNLQPLLKEGSVQIGHPVPQDGSWNQFTVNYPVGRTIADHATECYRLDDTGIYPLYDYDSYLPNLKRLSSNYYVPYITRVSILPKQIQSVPIVSQWQMFWANIFAFFQNKPFPYPSVPVGKN